MFGRCCDFGSDPVFAWIQTWCESGLISDLSPPGAEWACLTLMFCAIVGFHQEDTGPAPGQHQGVYSVGALSGCQGLVSFFLVLFFVDLGTLLGLT